MCIDCLKAQVDVTGGIEKNGEVVQCRKCERWHIFQDKWTYYALESAGLLSACLRKINGLNNSRTKLLDAHWIWTEPHSDRLKISVDIESEVLDDKVKLQQKAVIEFVVKHKQCMECIREATDHSWGAMIQIRQKVGHKQSLFLLEHLLTQAGLHNLMINITICKEGLDLFFKVRNQAERVVSFISSHMPIKIKKSQKLISRDLKSNFSRYELTYHLEIAPLCKGDLVITSKEFTGSLDLMVVTKLSSSVHLLNPMTLSKVEINTSKIFSSSRPTILLSAKNLTPFVVLDIIPVVEDKCVALEKGQKSMVKDMGGLLAEAEVARESDLGGNDVTYRVLTHLGHILQAGDSVLGYDLSRAVIDDELIGGLSFQPPDVVLVRKIYPEKTKKANKRKKRRTRRGKAKLEKSSEEFSDVTDDGSVATVEKEVVGRVKKIDKAGASTGPRGSSLFGWTGVDDEAYQEFSKRQAQEEEEDEEDEDDLDDLEELPEDMEREIEHAFGGLDLANGDNGDDEDDDKIEDGRIDLAAGGDEGEDVWDDEDEDDKIEDKVVDEMHNLPVPPK